MVVTISGPPTPYDFGSLGTGMYGDWKYLWYVSNTEAAVTINCTITGTHANNFQFDNNLQTKTVEVGNGTLYIPIRFAPLPPAGSKTATLTISCPTPDCDPAKQMTWTLEGTATSGTSYYLQVVNSPNGGGYVIVKDVDDVEIGSCYENQCTFGPYPNSTIFNLYAYPNTGYEFSTYSGGNCGSNNWCNCIINNANLTITADFTNTSETGACCDGATCTDSQTQSQCASPKIWHQGETCAQNPCTTDPIHACCVGTVCSLETQSDCTEAGGTWKSATTCSSTTCSGGTDDYMQYIPYALIGIGALLLFSSFGSE